MSRSPRTGSVPIRTPWGTVDDAVDAWFEKHWRGREPVDSVMYAATALGDHGLLWILLAAIQAARRPGSGRDGFVRVGVGLALESALVNGPVKWLFRRSRPSLTQPSPRRVRHPRTSSFPSGHASSAFFGAALLRDGDPLWPLYYAMAAVVAASRVHVRMHHASDVVAGALLGAALGEAARRLVPATSIEQASTTELPAPADQGHLAEVVSIVR